MYLHTYLSFNNAVVVLIFDGSIIFISQFVFYGLGGSKSDIMRLQKFKEVNSGVKIMSLCKDKQSAGGSHIVLQYNCNNQTIFLRSVQDALSYVPGNNEVRISFDYFGLQPSWYRLEENLFKFVIFDPCRNILCYR